MITDIVTFIRWPILTKPFTTAGTSRTAPTAIAAA
jgi:hypothetical protein